MNIEDYVRKYLTRARVEALLKKGHCPLCEIRLESVFHAGCPYLEVINTDKSLESLLFDN